MLGSFRMSYKVFIQLWLLCWGHSEWATRYLLSSDSLCWGHSEWATMYLLSSDSFCWGHSEWATMYLLSSDSFCWGHSKWTTWYLLSFDSLSSITWPSCEYFLFTLAKMLLLQFHCVSIIQCYAFHGPEWARQWWRKQVLTSLKALKNRVPLTLCCSRMMLTILTMAMTKSKRFQLLTKYPRIPSPIIFNTASRANKPAKTCTHHDIRRATWHSSHNSSVFKETNHAMVTERSDWTFQS